MNGISADERQLIDLIPDLGRQVQKRAPHCGIIHGDLELDHGKDAESRCGQARMSEVLRKRRESAWREKASARLARGDDVEF